MRERRIDKEQKRRTGDKKERADRKRSKDEEKDAD